MARLLVGLLLLCGCSPVRPMRAAITNGAADSGDPAVAQLVNETGGVACSGTLIGAHSVLTAAHCVSGTFRVELAGEVFAISRADTHPDFNGVTLDHDLAVLTLREAVAVTPLLIDDGAPMVGQTFAVVGFGTTGADAGDSGEKRRGSVVVTAVSALDFTTQGAPSQPCEGDSGGPALYSDAVVSGVASHGDAACSDHAVFARIDRAFVESVQIADGSAGVGERCYFDEQCKDGPCLTASDEPARAFCSRPCQGDADCPMTMTCAADGCRHRLPSPGAFGSQCAAEGDCVSGTCEKSMCTRRCVPNGKDCPAGFVCENPRGIDFYCARAAVEPSGCSMGRHGNPSLWIICLFLCVGGRRRLRAR